MRRTYRLRQRREFASVYRRGPPYRSNLAVLRALRTDRPLSRFGFTVRRTLGNAVVRNRIKRRLREIVRSLPVSTGWDIVLNARPAMVGTDFERIRENIRELMARAGVLDGEGSSTC